MVINMIKFKEHSLVFLIGAFLYSIIEIIYRGYTHWSMAILGGLCLLIMYRHFTTHPDTSIFRKCLFGAFTITALEFVTGCIVNLWLGWNVWDYSDLYMNLFGQVCLMFSTAWYFITIPAVFLCRFLGKLFRPRTVHA